MEDVLHLFDYELPEERIAQRPVYPYDHAKMLVVDRAKGSLQELRFADLPEIVSPRDCFVFNNSKVIPARLHGVLQETGGAAEVLLLRCLDPVPSAEQWICLGKPSRRLVPGAIVKVGTELVVRVLRRLEGNEFVAELCSEAPLRSLLQKVGMMPIPPYIRKGISDRKDGEDYQTPFGTVEGSVAAPTASLHFTPAVMDRLCDKGCKVLNCTLHLGQASFLPLWREPGDPVRPPASELLSFSEEVRNTILEHRQNGGRIVAVGTSMVRALETIAQFSGPAPGRGSHRDSRTSTRALTLWPPRKTRPPRPWHHMHMPDHKGSCCLHCDTRRSTAEPGHCHPPA